MERYFILLNEAKIMIEGWRVHCNTKRLHASSGRRLRAPEKIQISNKIMNCEN